MNKSTGEDHSKYSTFISHSSVDKPFVHQLAKDLEVHSVKCWVDEAEIAPGDDFISRISDGLSKATHVLIILSEHSLISSWVREETHAAQIRAVNGEARLIPVLLGVIKIDDIPLLLKSRLYVDFRDPTLYHDALQKLLAAFQKGSKSLVADIMGELHYVLALPEQQIERKEELDTIKNLLLKSKNKSIWGHDHRFSHSNQQISDLGMQNQPRLETAHIERTPQVAIELTEMRDGVAGQNDDQGPIWLTGKKNKAAIWGMGGIGKTVLATMVANDEDIKKQFVHGIIWITLGQEPNIIERQRSVLRAIDNKIPIPSIEDEKSGKNEISEQTKNKKILLIIDDIWDLRHVEYFDSMGDQCKILITTRNREIVRSLGAQEFNVDLLSEKQSLQLLAQWAQIDTIDELTDIANEIIRECGRLPLALAMIGAMIRFRPDAWEAALYRLQHADLEKLKRQFPGYEYENILISLQISIDYLDDTLKNRYWDLAVFAEDIPIPWELFYIYWKNDFDSMYDIDDILHSFIDRSLLKKDKEHNAVTLHDLQKDYIVKQVHDKKILHEKLINAYRKQCDGEWHKGPDDGYYFQYLPYHFAQAGQFENLRLLLLDYSWIYAKIRSVGIHNLIRDFDFMPIKEELELVQQVLRLSIPFLYKNPDELAGQLTGRLLWHSPTKPSIVQFLDEIKQKHDQPWLRPLTPSLLGSQSGLIVALPNHSSELIGASFLFGKPYLIVAYADQTVKQWDLNLYNEAYSQRLDFRPQASYSYSFYAESAYSEPFLFCSFNLLSSAEGDIKVFGTTEGVLCVVSRLRIRDTTTQFSFQVRAHTGPINSIAISTRNLCFASSSQGDPLVKIWSIRYIPLDLHLIQEIHVGKGLVEAMAIDDTDRFLAIGFVDSSLQVWDIEKGTEFCTFTGHNSNVKCISWIYGKKLLTSGSLDSTLRIWDLITRKQIQVLIGHTKPITALAVMSKEGWLVSCADDEILFWDIVSGAKLGQFECKGDKPKSIMISPDGNKIVSVIQSGILKIWEIKRISKKPVIDMPLQCNVPREIEAFSEDDLEMHLRDSLLTNSRSVVTSPNGRFIVQLSIESLEVWDGTPSDRWTEYDKWVTARDNINRINHTLIPPRATGYNPSLPGDFGGSVSSKGWPILIAPDSTKAIVIVEDRGMKVFDLESGEEIWSFGRSGEEFNAIGIAEARSMVAIGLRDGRLMVRSLTYGHLIAELHVGAVIISCIFYHNDDFIVAKDSLGKIHYFSLDGI